MTRAPGAGHWSLAFFRWGQGHAEAVHDLHDPGAASEDLHHDAVPGHLPDRLLHPPADDRPGQAGQEDGRPAVRGVRPDARPGVHVLRRQPVERLHLRPRHHAVHLGVDHPAAPRGVGAFPVPGEIAQGAERAEEDQRVYKISDHTNYTDPGHLLDTRYYPAGAERNGVDGPGVRGRLEVLLVRDVGCPDRDRRDHVPDVAGRAN